VTKICVRGTEWGGGWNQGSIQRCNYTNTRGTFCVCVYFGGGKFKVNVDYICVFIFIFLLYHHTLESISIKNADMVIYPIMGLGSGDF
jgi:hypothetical protein